MEGSESEAVFESLNLNPRLLLNEILNTVENLLDDAFDFFHQEASTLLNAEATDRSQHLTQGIGHIRNEIQSNVGRRLGMWQEYCLRRCFTVPQGFSLQKSKESMDEGFTCQDMLCEPNLDAKLDSLRDRLNLIGKESAELNRELQALERESTSNAYFAATVNEALQLYEQNHGDEMLQEMMSAASELRTKVQKLRTKRVEDIDCIRTKRICYPNRDLLTLNHGLSSANLEDLQEFLADLKKM